MPENTITLDPTTDKTAAALVATIKAAVNGEGKYAAYVAAHPTVTHDTVKDHALALAVLAYPNDAPVQKKDGTRTRFGKAVAAAANGLRYALPAKDGTTPDWLALAVQAAKNATAHEITAEDVLTAVKAAIAAQA